MSTKYRLWPTIAIDGTPPVSGHGYANLAQLLTGFCVLETYPGFPTSDLVAGLRAAGYDGRIALAEFFCPLTAAAFRTHIKDDLTEDPVFGRFTTKEYADFFDRGAIDAFVSQAEGKVLVVGVCASLFKASQTKVFYADMARWRLRKSYQSNEPVFFKGSLESDEASNFKRGYFVEWRMADRIKRDMLRRADYFLTVHDAEVSYVAGDGLRNAIVQATRQPFRLVPHFDASVAGGQWMAAQLGAKDDGGGMPGRCFDGAFDECAVIVRFANGFEYEMPAANLALFAPKELLGERGWSRFGTDFPIRFTLLDTTGGSHLDLRVNPSVEYVCDHFGSHLAQDGSHYILATEDKEAPTCHLGLRDGVSKSAFLAAVRAVGNGSGFDPAAFANTYDVRPHDHFLHPAGCVYSLGAGYAALEISSAPHALALNLWRSGEQAAEDRVSSFLLRAAAVLRPSFDGTRSRAECVNVFGSVQNHDGAKEERTGLHPNQFIEARRWKIMPLKTARLSCHGSVNMLNLVEGEEITVCFGADLSRERSFTYAETFVVPESVCDYTITNTSDKPVLVLQAFVRGCD